jgi:hypothetical protein
VWLPTPAIFSRSEPENCAKVSVSASKSKSTSSSSGNIASPPERTFALVVSAHGALLSLRTDAALGDALTVRNVKTKEDVSCWIVDCGEKKGDIANVGVEFVDPQANFWHVAVPPADWSPRSAEAKSYRPQVVKNAPAAKT